MNVRILLSHFRGAIVLSNLTGDGGRILAQLHPAAPGSILRVPENNLLLQRFIDGPAKNSGQRLDNVNQTHLVLASGKPVLKKNLTGDQFQYRPPG